MIELMKNTIARPRIAIFDRLSFILVITLSLVGKVRVVLPALLQTQDMLINENSPDIGEEKLYYGVPPKEKDVFEFSIQRRLRLKQTSLLLSNQASLP